MPDTGLSWPGKVGLLGVDVTPTTYDEAVQVILEAARHRTPAVVSCHSVHAIVTASRDPVLRNKVNTFDMITPDGQPVRWALNQLYGVGLRDRVYGPALMLRLCQQAATSEIPIYLYGSSPVVAEQLRANLQRDYPTLQIVGCESPPFRVLTAEEETVMIERINASGAGLVFIGLGCPKQDVFAFTYRERINAVLVCVGAAFDFHAGAKPMAPCWMQRWGLEWLFRLLQEPRRLWHRYLVTNTIFLVKLAGVIIGQRLRRTARTAHRTRVPPNASIPCQERT